MAISIYSASTSPLGKSLYRYTGIDAPAMFIPTLTFEARQSAQGKNVWVTVNSEYPIIAVVDGVTTVTDTFKIKSEFTALQNITAATERERLFDEFVAFLTANKVKILAGKVI